MTGRKRKYCDKVCGHRAQYEREKVDGRRKEQKAKHRDTTNAWQKTHRVWVTKTCPCGEDFTIRSGEPRQTCSQTCTRGFCDLPADHPAMILMAAMRKAECNAKVDALRLANRTPLIVALDKGDNVAAIAAIKDKTVVSESGCWEWQQRVNKEGYPSVNIRKTRRGVMVHRLVCELTYGALGIQAAHHKCANTICVNPDHLQPISYRENTAEMMQRNYYVNRILELEDALASVAPNHPAIQVALLPRSA